MKFLLKCILSLTLLCSMAGCETATIPDVNPSVRTGDFPPDLLGQTFDGRQIYLSEFRGKIVMLVFWKTWCNACKIELQQAKALARAYPADLVIVAVNIGEQSKMVKTFRQHYMLDFPVLLDRESKVSAAYGIRVWPTTILINKQGRVHFSTVGSQMDRLRQEIEKLREEQQGL